jgi:hypothetical protein
VAADVLDALTPTVRLALGVSDDVAPAEFDTVALAVWLADAPLLSVVVGVGERLDESESVLDPESLDVPDGEGERDAVPEIVPDCELVGLPLAVIDAVGLDEMLTVDVPEGVIEELGEWLAEPPTLSVVDGVALGVEDRLIVLELLCVVDGDCEGVRDDVPVPEIVIRARGIRD